jgi:preprotein translocase subunit YajC
VSKIKVDDIESLVGEKVINQDGIIGVITEVDEAPGVAYPIKVTF